MNVLRTSVFSLGLLLLSTVTNATQKEIPIPNDPLELRQINNSLDSLVINLEQKGFDINSLLADPRFEVYPNIKELFEKAPEKIITDYEKYKEKIGFKNKKQQMPLFIEKNLINLKEAEEKYNIPKEIIASVLAIESDFGKNEGSFNPFNAYVSLYLSDYKKQFAFDQLEELLTFSNKKNIDVLKLTSSYAGATGHAQFLPYSLNKWFIGDDVYDMDNNISSVASYLSYFKEKRTTLENAIYAYNNKDFYVRAVFDLAK